MFAYMRAVYATCPLSCLVRSCPSLILVVHSTPAHPPSHAVHHRSAQHFYCYMNPNADASSCTHIPVPGERWTQSPNNSGGKKRQNAAAAKAERAANIKSSKSNAKKRIKLDADPEENQEEKEKGKEKVTNKVSAKAKQKSKEKGKDKGKAKVCGSI